MRKPYCCEASRGLYEQYYTRQQKGSGDFPVYVGALTQRGHGLGNIIGSFFRRILPTLKSFAPHALRTAATIFDDVVGGKTIKDATFQRVPETIKNFAFGKTEQSGSGYRRKRKASKKTNKKAKRRRRDIFS